MPLITVCDPRCPWPRRKRWLDTYPGVNVGLIWVDEHRVVCFGNASHRRRDGSCKHTDLALAGVKPEYRQAIRVEVPKR